MIFRGIWTYEALDKFFNWMYNYSEVVYLNYFFDIFWRIYGNYHSRRRQSWLRSCRGAL